MPGDVDEDYPFLQKRDVHALTDAVRALNITLTRIEPMLGKFLIASESTAHSCSHIPKLASDIEQLLDVLVVKATNGDADALAEKANQP